MDKYKKAKEYYVVSKLYHFEELLKATFGKVNISFEEDASKHYLPVFDDYKFALKEAGGDKKLVFTIRECS